MGLELLGTVASATLFPLLYLLGCFDSTLDVTSIGRMCPGVLFWMIVWFAIGRF